MHNIKFLLFRISIFAIACFAQIPGNAAINIIDACDRQPVVAASIFNNKGVLLGISDENGSFLSAKPSDFPLSVQCLGYEFNTVESDGSTIELLSRSYNLPEALVSDKSRDGLKILLYIRELSTFIADGDTTLVISENMADVILPTRPKIKGFKGHNKAQILNKRNFARYIKHDGTDSIARDIDTGAMSMISIISSIDTLSLVETPRLRTVASGFDTIMTKKNATIIYRKSQSSYTQSYDPLWGKENHKVSPSVLKLLGMTIDINEAFNNKSFYRNDSGKYRIQDMIQETYSISALAKGKLWKTVFHAKSDILLKSLIEIYPVDFEYLTLEECKELSKEKNIAKPDFIVPQNVSPLDATMQSIVDRAMKLNPKNTDRNIEEK